MASDESQTTAETAIESRYGVCGGAPCIQGTRIATQHVFGMFMAGTSIAEVASEYSLTEEQVQAAIRFEGKRHGH